MRKKQPGDISSLVIILGYKIIAKKWKILCPRKIFHSASLMACLNNKKKYEVVKIKIKVRQSNFIKTR
jgi:hypothetical protein